MDERRVRCMFRFVVPHRRLVPGPAGASSGRGRAPPPAHATAPRAEESESVRQARQTGRDEDREEKGTSERAAEPGPTGCTYERAPYQTSGLSELNQSTKVLSLT